jgi:hypothetical protein
MMTSHSDMGIFVVVKWGVYMQEIYGPYDDKYIARQAAIRLAKADEDSYHKWRVHQLSRDGLRDETFCIWKETADMIG